MVPEQPHASSASPGMPAPQDKSTAVGGRRNAVGNDATAGNSVPSVGTMRNTQSVTAVGMLPKRFGMTRTRAG